MKMGAMSALILWGVAISVWGKPFKKGFDLENATIPLKDIKDGGPRRDGIPAIDEPKFLPVMEVDFLKDDDLLMSMSLGGVTRGYPIRILDHHEIVNDQIGDLAFAVTYCPLCGTGMIFDRTIEGEITTFGVSGLLYQSDVLLYDRATESLWSQLMMECISGDRVGMRLTWLPSEFMTWASWKDRYPGGKVLSNKTGHRRNYQRTLYRGYEDSESVYFPVPLYRDDLGIKDWILGVELNGKHTAYDLRLFESGRVYGDEFGGRKLRLQYDPLTRHAQVTDTDSGDKIPHVFAYWFAWQAFYPGTRLMSSEPK